MTISSNEARDFRSLRENPTIAVSVIVSLLLARSLFLLRAVITAITSDFAKTERNAR